VHDNAISIRVPVVKVNYHQDAIDDVSRCHNSDYRTRREDGTCRAVMPAKVHSAAVMDRDGVELLPEQSLKGELPGMKQVWLDGGYEGEGKGEQWIKQHIGRSAETVRPPSIRESSRMTK
jgi:hypothetical protein